MSNSVTLPPMPELPTNALDLRAAIARQVVADRDEIIAALQRLVRIPSVTGEEGAVQNVVAELMRDAGLEVDVWEPTAAELAPYAEHVGEFTTLAGRPNVVGTRRGAGGGRSLILNAHLDVVDAGDPALWQHAQYGGEVIDGNLYGRGSCDMKAGYITNHFALETLRRLGVRLRGDVFLESVISEEDGGAGALATILRGYRADGGIITEPTRLAAIAAQGGSLVFRLTVTGRSAHACVRDEGVSAIDKFWVLHQAMLAFEAERNATIDHPLYAPIANKIPINVGTIRGGNWPSSAPESLVAEGRAGLVPGETLEGFKAEFVAMLMDAAAADPWLRDHPPVIEWFSGQFAPAEVALDEPILGAIRAAHAFTTGAEPAVEAVTYGADMRHFVVFGDTPCIMYGAGDVRLAHFTDEHVPIADVLTAIETIALATAAWCGIA